MNTYTKLLLRVIVFISLIYGLSTTVSAQTKKLLSVQDYTSIAKITSKAEGTDLTFTRPYSPGGSMTIFAGVFNGTLNSVTKKFYCIDLSRDLAYSPAEYWDEGFTPAQITYILNNYYPLKTSYTGKLTDNNKEAAAVQIAIWYFSDNVNANTVTDATIKTRALTIIADATLNAGNTNPLATLQVIPTNQTVPAGTPASFYVQAISLSNTPVSGVTIQLTTTLGTLSTTSVITGPDGKTPTITLNYGSNGTASVKAKATVEIPQGTKYVHKTNPNDHQKLVLATPATDVKEVFTNIEFTSCKNTIGDFVWHDANANGIQDDGSSSGIGGVVVQLLQGTTVKQTTTTGATGFYQFTNVDNGTYTVQIATSNFTGSGALAGGSASENWFMTLKGQGGDTAKDSDGDPSTNSASVTLNCANNMKIDFGFFKVCISLQKTGPASVNVGDKITYSFTVTNCGDVLLAGGARVYDALLNPAGDHQIQYLTLTPGQSATFTYDYTTTPNNCGNLVNNAWVIGFPSLGGYNFNGATVRADDSHTVNVICNASIGDKVWIDTNGNGLQDYGEVGKSGVTVKLYDCNDNLKGTTTTNTSGNYLFNNLIPGSYYVKFDLPTGFSFTTKDAGNDAIDSDADPITGKTICTTLSAGENDLTWDAGLKECKNKIGNFVWHDANANGIQDNNEPGIQGVVVELLNSAGGLIITTTTVANGYYEFANLSNGTYGVRVANSNYLSGGVLFSTAQTKWYATKKNIGSDDTKDSDALKNESVSVTLSCDENITIDFGFYKTCVSITKTADKQVAKPGEVVNYTLTVENCGDIPLASGVDIYDTMFPKVGKPNPLNVNLNAGNFYVVNYSYTVTADDCDKPLKNTARAVGHPADGSADVEFTADVTVNVDCSQCSNKIGDFVWRDLNANGIQNTGESGISGVLVELLIGGSPYKTTTTDGTGKYKFENIPNGTYEVRIAPSNYAMGGVLYSTSQTKWYASPKNQGSDDSKDSDANLGEKVFVTVGCNDNLTIDFGFYKTCVTITKTADKQTAKPGDIINYTLTVENCGDIALASGVDIYDDMFPKVGIQNPLNVTIGAGSFSVKSYSYTVTDNDCGGEIINTAKAVGRPANGSDYVVDESTWKVIVTCDLKADLKIEKTVDNQNPRCGDYITFTIKVTNNGPSKSKGVEVTDLLPTGLDYLSSTSSQGTFNSSTGRWLVGDLNNGASATLTIRVNVNCDKINSSTFVLEQAKGYNLFVIEDLNQPSSDTQGKMAVGRDAYLANYSVGDILPPNSGDVLVVGRNLQFVSGRVYNGNAVYGNSTNLPIGPVTIDGSLRKDSPIDFVSAKAYLENLSTMLSSYTVNGTTTFQWSGLTLTGTDPYLNVFKVSGANLSAATSVTINAPNGSVVLVNIDGAYVTWTGGHVVNGTSIGNVLYNFYQSTNLQIRAIDVRGSVLAPFAALYFPSGLISGQVICKSMVGAGQFNLSPFVGNIPCDKEITNVACITGTTTTDPNTYNNSASVKIKVSNNGCNTCSGNIGNWQFTSGFAAGEIIYSMTSINSDVSAGTSSGKIYKSTNRGQTWTIINSSMNVSFIWSQINNNGLLFAATEQGIFKYNGFTWTLAGLFGKDVHSLVAKNGILYAGTWGFGVYKSIDNGSTWLAINSGLGSSLTIQSLTITNNGDVFAGTVGGGLYKSTNGLSWNKIGSGNDLIWSLGSTSSAIFAGTYGDGLYRSIDGGYNFTKLTSLNVPFIYSIVSDGTGKVYVSSLTSGVFVSSDNGYTWTSLGMGGVGVSSVTVSSSSGLLYAGTKSGQVYSISSNNNATDVNDNLITPTEYKLAQNYPNPFNPSTTIEFAVPNAGMYSLKVYNTLGQEVANLVENELASGLHKVTFDASKLASGMYIYKLSGNNVNVSKKMILMK
ncbi:MAG: SdrD B-like domain-containing protein [Melioribacteraceae bacterium]